MANLLKFVLPKTTQCVRTIFRSSTKFEKLQAGLHKVNNLEKKFLVWTGKFKTVEEIPAMIPFETVEKARNRMRIRIANIMMGLTLVICLCISIYAKKEHASGKSVAQMNRDWHTQMDKEAKDGEKNT